MDIPKEYFRDKAVLLLIGCTVFAAFLCIVLVLLRTDIGQGVEGYIIGYRANLGLSAFERGSIVQLFSFVFFVIITASLNLMLSVRTYRLRRSLSLTVLSAGLLIIVLALIVSNALLAVN